MAWHYLDLPEALRLPPCQRCRNRARIRQVAPNVYVCGDCGHAFAAVWRSEAPIPEIAGVWVCRGWRRQGVATALVDALARYADTPRADLCWGSPFSGDGKALAFSLAGPGGQVRVS